MRRFSSYDFGTKMRLNAFVIEEIANALHPGAAGKDMRQIQNDVANGLQNAGEVHRLVGELAKAIKDEADRQIAQKSLPSVAARVASRWLNGL
jgi:hypothetical protein